MAARVRVAGAGILYSGERILLAQRHPDSRFFGGFFSFIGGALEKGESPLEATVREVAEELGIRIEAGAGHDVVGVLTTPPFSPIRFETHFFAFPWADEAAPHLHSSELVALRWETPAEWLRLWERRELRIPPPVLHILRFAARHDHTLGPELWQRCRAKAEEYQRHEQQEKTKLHQIFFVPGLLMAPLRTPTLPPATHTNCYILGQREGYVVDPASSEQGEQEALDALLEEVDFRPKAVILTHHHSDHSAGAAAFARRWGVPVLGHALAAARVPGCEGTLEDGMVLGTDVEDWQVLHTPGHARGHICLLGKSSRSVIAGDMISTMSTILIDPPEGHMATYLASLDRLSGLEVDALYPSHGPPAWRPGEVLSYFKRHRQEREEKVFSAVGAATTELSEIVATAYDDVSEKLWPLAQRSATAHLIHLQEQARIEQTGDNTWKRSA